MENFIKFREAVEDIKEKALEYGYNEAESFYLLTVAAEEIKNDHLAEGEEIGDYEEDLGDEYDEEDLDEDIEGEAIDTQNNSNMVKDTSNVEDIVQDHQDKKNETEIVIRKPVMKLNNGGTKE